MNALLADLVPALGWALVDFLWQGAVIGAIAWALLALLRDARPQARYAVLLAAMAACVLLPALAVLEAAGTDAPGFVPSTQALVAIRFDAGAVEVAPDWRAPLQAHMPQVVMAWCLGAGLLALRFALGLAWVGRLRNQGAMPGFDWQARLERLAAAVGLAQPPELRLVDGLEGPAVAGWWRPVVLMPTALVARMSPDLLEALLAHELAHVRRHDYLVNLLQGVVESLLFYHPVVWWLSKRTRIEREQIADDLALRAIPDSRRLALALQRLDQLQDEAARDRISLPLHLAPAAHGGQLMNRIRRLIRPQRAGLHWKSGLPLLAVGALCVAVVAQAVPSAAPTAAAASRPQASWAPSAVSAVDAVAPVAAAAPVALAAPAASPAPAAAVAPVAAVAAVDAETESEKLAWSAQRGQPYALVRDGREGMMLSGDMDDMAEVKRTRLHVRGDFLWFRRDGAGYIVQDPALLAEVREAWAPSEAVGEKMDVLGKQMEPHSKKMEALGRQMERLSEADRPQREKMEAVSRRMQPLAEQQRELGAKMQVIGEKMGATRNDDERDRLSRQMDALSAQMEPLNAQMSKLSAQMSAESERMRDSHEPMQRLGEQMREASEPMQALGEKLGALGKEQERLAHQADAHVQKVIDRALREGKAERSAQVSAK